MKFNKLFAFYDVIAPVWSQVD